MQGKKSFAPPDRPGGAPGPLSAGVVNPSAPPDSMTDTNKISGKAEAAVSIVVPCFNSEAFIAPCLKSVQEQTFQRWECIIVDDCSTDRSKSLVRTFTKGDHRFKLIELKANGGAAKARAQAIEASAGDFVAFLDSDDVWEPQKLARQIPWLEKNGFLFGCSSYGKIDENGRNLGYHVTPPPVWDYSTLLHDCPGNSTVIVKGDLIRGIEVPDIRKRNDYLLWLKVIKQAENLHGLNEPLAYHRVHGDGISRSKSSLIRYHWKIYREYENLGFWKSANLVFYWIVRKGVWRSVQKRIRKS